MTRSLAVLVAVVLLLGVEVSHAEMSDAEKAVYARGVEYCRGDVQRPMALNPDKNVLCFDGGILRDQDIPLVESLSEDGLFVVRSFGGDRYGAVRLAEAVRQRNATVVVYDYCMSSCASYLLVASATAFVARNTLVAWDFVANPYECHAWKEAKDGGPPRLERSICPDAPPEHQSMYKYYSDMDEWFYRTRTADPKFEFPPESIVVRRILRSRFQGTGTYPDHLLWTWNPRYYASAITTKVTYEAYPQSQDEVDTMASRLLPFRVTYDP